MGQQLCVCSDDIDHIDHYGKLKPLNKKDKDMITSVNREEIMRFNVDKAQKL